MPLVFPFPAINISKKFKHHDKLKAEMEKMFLQPFEQKVYNEPQGTA